METTAVIDRDWQEDTDPLPTTAVLPRETDEEWTDRILEATAPGRGRVLALRD